MSITLLPHHKLICDSEACQLYMVKGDLYSCSMAYNFAFNLQKGSQTLQTCYY